MTRQWKQCNAMSNVFSSHLKPIKHLWDVQEKQVGPMKASTHNLQDLKIQVLEYYYHTLQDLHNISLVFNDIVKCNVKDRQSQAYRICITLLAHLDFYHINKECSGDIGANTVPECNGVVMTTDYIHNR